MDEVDFGPDALRAEREVPPLHRRWRGGEVLIG
jgi:hypothetical protein